MQLRLSPNRLTNGSTLPALWLSLALLLALPAAARAQASTAAKVAAPAAPAPAPNGPTAHDSYAILVGADRYDSVRIAPVEGASSDALGIANALNIFAGFESEQLTLLYTKGGAFKQPTRENILAALARLEGRLGPQSLLIFSFTGRAVEARGRSYLLPSDAAVTHDPTLLEETAVRADLLKAMIEATGAGHVLLLLDTHRAMQGAAGTAPLRLPTKRFQEGFRFDLRGVHLRAFATVFAASPGEVSFAHKGSECGLFAWAVLKAFEKEAAEGRGRLDIARLLDYVKLRVNSEATTQMKVGQRPSAFVEGFEPGAVLLTASGRGSNALVPFRGNVNPNVAGATEIPDKPPTRIEISIDRHRSSEDPEVYYYREYSVRKLWDHNATIIGGPTKVELDMKVERQHWELIRQSPDPNDFKAYINLYPSSPFAAAAGARLQQLNGAAAARVRRFPAVRCPDNVTTGEEFGVTVQLTKDRLTPDVSSDSPAGDVPVEPEPEQATWEVEVVLHADGFAIRDGRNTARLTMSRERDSTKALFHLRARPLKGWPPMRRLEVEFWQHGTLVATATKEVTVAAPRGGGGGSQSPFPGPTLYPLQNGPGPYTSSRELNHETLPDSGHGVTGEEAMRQKTRREPPDFTFDSLSSPDLTVRIKHVSAGRPDTFSVKVTSPHFEPGVELVEEFTKSRDHAQWLKELYSRIVPLSARGAVSANVPATAPAPPVEARKKMRDIGREIFRRTPEVFQKGFWGVNDLVPGGRFRSIQIIADDPLFPWELAFPYRENVRGVKEERVWLGVGYQVARWPLERGDMVRPGARKSLHLGKIYAIVPRYGAGSALPGQQKELNALASVSDYVSIPARLEDLQKFFADLPSGIIHFAGHGVVGVSAQNFDQYQIELEGGTVLTLDDWRTMTDNPRGNNPLIFFNACEVGDTSRVAGFVNGWAPVALRAGAGGYIGTLWLISDEGAAEFGGEFYRALLKQASGGYVSVAQLLREMRVRFLLKGDPTYLSYVYYGDHELVCIMPQAEGGNAPRPMPPAAPSKAPER